MSPGGGHSQVRHCIWRLRGSTTFFLACHDACARAPLFSSHGTAPAREHHLFCRMSRRLRRGSWWPQRPQLLLMTMWTSWNRCVRLRLPRSAQHMPSPSAWGSSWMDVATLRCNLSGLRGLVAGASCVHKLHPHLEAESLAARSFLSAFRTLVTVPSPFT